MQAQRATYTEHESLAASDELLREACQYLRARGISLTARTPQQIIMDEAPTEVDATFTRRRGCWYVQAEGLEEWDVCYVRKADGRIVKVRVGQIHVIDGVELASFYEWGPQDDVLVDEGFWDKVAARGGILDFRFEGGGMPYLERKNLDGTDYYRVDGEWFGARRMISVMLSCKRVTAVVRELTPAPADVLGSLPD